MCFHIIFECFACRLKRLDRRGCEKERNVALCFAVSMKNRNFETCFHNYWINRTFIVELTVHIDRKQR